MNMRFSHTSKPYFPIYGSNLRMPYKNRNKKKLGHGTSGRTGMMSRSLAGSRPHSRTWEGGTFPLFKRVPRWPEAAMRNKIKRLEPLNLSKLRMAIEKGRLDTRFPITQRHLYDSRTVTRIKRGVGLFNVNDFPFPYKIDIEVAGADQSTVDAIRAVGGTITIVYMEPVTLRAHVKPWKYEVLPRTARPTLKMVHYLEKMKARGAIVRYIKPLWLIEEERRLQTQLRELQGDDGNIAAERMARANEPIGM
jgi:large subunit ribosomal protein L15